MKTNVSEIHAMIMLLVLTALLPFRVHVITDTTEMALVALILMSVPLEKTNATQTLFVQIPAEVMTARVVAGTMEMDSIARMSMNALKMGKMTVLKMHPAPISTDRIVVHVTVDTAATGKHVMTSTSVPLC